MFKDIGKAVKDLLEDDYFYVQKLSVKTKNDAEWEVCGDTEFGSKGPNATLTAARVGNFLSLDKLRIKSDGRVLAEASLRTSAISKFTVSAEDGRQEPGKPLQSFGKLGCEFKTQSIVGDADIDVVNGPLLRSSILYKYNSCLSVGAEALIHTHFEDKDCGPEISDVNVGFSYHPVGWCLSMRTNESLGALRFRYLHSVTPALSVATQLDYRLKSNAQRLVFGGDYKLDDKSTVKAKIDSGAVASAVFLHRLSEQVKLTLCAEVNVQDWAADSHKFGIGLNFE